MDRLFEHSAGFPFPEPVNQESAPKTEGGSEANPPAVTVTGPEGPKTKPAIQASPLPGTGGVYLLTDDEDRIIQLASSGNLRRALQIRLAGPVERELPSEDTASRRRANLRDIVRKIRWRPAHSAFEISYEYWRLVRILQPDTYLKLLAFGPAWFLHVDPASPIPRFLAARVLRSPPGVDLGPFFTNGDATRFVQILEDGFDLCRYYQILEQAPRGKACAYFDMGRCPAPCDGSIPLSRYREMITDALGFAAGDRDCAYERCENAMREAAGRQAYEEAGRIKQRLARLREVEYRTYAQIGPIERFNWLIVQRGGGSTKVKPFFVRAGAITPGEPVALKQLDAAVGKWSDAMAAGPGKPIPDATSPDRQSLSEQIWLISHFLGKKDPPGVFLNANRLPRADLAAIVREYFRKPEPPPEPEPPTAAPEPASPESA